MSGHISNFKGKYSALGHYTTFIYRQNPLMFGNYIIFKVYEWVTSKALPVH